jgi:hypothetical protein
MIRCNVEDVRIVKMGCRRAVGNPGVSRLAVSLDVVGGASMKLSRKFSGGEYGGREE